MILEKRVAARAAEFALLLAFVGLTSLPGLAQERANQPHIGLVQDWSHRHTVFTNTNDVPTRVKQGSDLRALSSWARRTRVQSPHARGGAAVEHQDEATNNKKRDERRDRATHNKKKKKGGGGSGGAISGVSVDWALPLGKGTGASAANYAGLAAGAYPAKYTFDINAAPDCTNDYIAMGLNTPGAAGYPNIVGVNNLYSNSGGTGFCSGTGPAAYFAYYTASANPTSMVVSLDGTKIAWVENAATAVLHVLAWKANDGTLAAPVPLSPRVVATAPAVGSGNMTSLTLTGATTGDTNSSPYVDYTTDTAYVASNNGLLFKIQNVFCQTIASPAANSTCATAPPALDGSWTTNPVTVSAGILMTSPVLDQYLATPLVFFGGSDGTVYARVAATGLAPTSGALPVGDGSASGGIVDPPVVDVTNHQLYVTTGCLANTDAVAVQNPYTSTGFGASVTATIGHDGSGLCPTTNMHAGTPDDAYITAIQSGTTTFSGNMIFCGTVQGAIFPSWQAVLYKFPVTNGVMSATAAATSGAALTNGMGAAANAECSAVTDLFNSNFASQKERIYMGLGGATDGHLRSFDAAFTTPAASVPKALTAAWTSASSVITFPISNSPITIGPGNYVTIAGTAAGTCNADTNGTFEVSSSTTTQIVFNNPAVTTPSCTGTAAGNATSDSTIPGISLVDITVPAVTRATSGIIIDNVAATGAFAEASNIYFTQLAPGNIAGGSCPATATISSITFAGSTVTVNTAAAHGLAVGDTVTVAGATSAGNNGVWTVATVPLTTRFTYTDAGGAAQAGAGGSVYATTCIYKLSQAGLQ